MRAIPPVDIFCLVDLTGAVPGVDLTAGLQQAVGDGLGAYRFEALPDSPVVFGWRASAPAAALARDGHALATVADARLDNREELQAALGEAGDDASLILAAFRRWGRGCVDRLLGAFAFVVWDARSRELLAARDHIGEAPLHYAQHGRFLVIASRARAIAMLSGWPRRLNPTYLCHLFSSEYPPVEQTAFDGIERLAPGQRLACRNGGVAVERYWHLDASRCAERLRDAAEYKDAFVSVMSAAVAARAAPAASGNAALLSGGLDSSLIACLLGEVVQAGGGAGPLRSFTFDFPHLEGIEREICCDDAQYATIVAQARGFDARLLDMSGAGPLTRLDAIMRPLDSPYLPANIYLYDAASRAASDLGVRVLFDGNDGDTVVGYGYELLPRLFTRGRWVTLLHELRAMQSIGLDRGALPRLFWRYGVRPLVQSRRQRAGERAVSLPSWVRVKVPPSAPAGDPQLRDLDSPAHCMTLEFCRAFAASYGMAMALPFYDRRVVEFCLGLPDDQRLAHGWSRAIQRNALADYVPRSVSHRVSKSNLSPNFYRWLHGPQESELVERVLASADLLPELIDRAQLEPTVKQWAGDGRRDRSATVRFFFLAAIQSWVSQLR